MQNRMTAYLPARVLSSGIDRVLDEFWRGLSGPQGAAPQLAAAFPAVNVWETAEALHVELELPGVKREDLDVQVEKDELTVRGAFADRAEGATYHRRERGEGTFSRVLRLPVAVDSERAAARLERGELSVDPPKAEAGRARKVPGRGSEG